MKYDPPFDSRKVFWSGNKYGCDELIASAIGLDRPLPLPVGIAHGVDFYHLRIDSDLHAYEPIYMAFREDIAERVAKVKPVLRFPHPWLFIISEHRKAIGRGTLFVTPPPSREHSEAMLEAIMPSNYPKPWGVLVKQRGVEPEDFHWWERQGFSVHSAGASRDRRFLYNLRDIFARYQCVASPNMSSALVFAAAMNRRTFALPNVRITCVDVSEWDQVWILDDTDGRIAATWRKLLSDDLAVARSEAELLLGVRYMAEPEELKERFEKAVESVADRPVHLYPLGHGVLYKLCVWLMGKGLPVQKLFPNPFVKVTTKVLGLLRLNRLTIWHGSDFAHYGVAGDPHQLRYRKVVALSLGRSGTPGYAVRDAQTSELVQENRRPG